MACGPERCCNLGFNDFTLNLKAGRSKEWDSSARERIDNARHKLPRPLEGWAHSCKRIGDQIVLRVKSTTGHALTATEDIYFYSRLNHINTLVEQEIKMNNDIVSIGLPISDYAPETIEKLVGLLYHPDGWPGNNGQKYMPIDLRFK